MSEPPDRIEFVVGHEAAAAWDRLQRKPARDLPGLRDLLARPSPFSGDDALGPVISRDLSARND